MTSSGQFLEYNGLLGRFLSYFSNIIKTNIIVVNNKHWSTIHEGE